MKQEKKAETKESWVTPDKFENDCRPERRETGIKGPVWLEEMVEKAKVKKANSAKG